MDELELLKNHWKKQTDFPHKSKSEMHLLIRKSSSNVLKWIIIINILEFAFFFLLPLLMKVDDSKDGYTDSQLQIINISEYISYAIPVIFIVLYIRLMRRIQVTDTVSTLLSNILQARKLLNIYIYTNITIFSLAIIFGAYIGIQQDEAFAMSSSFGPFYRILIITFIVIMVLVFLLFAWLFYKLLYGFLMRRLKRNYEHLKQIE